MHVERIQEQQRRGDRQLVGGRGGGGSKVSRVVLLNKPEAKLVKRCLSVSGYSFDVRIFPTGTRRFWWDTLCQHVWRRRT